MTEWTANDVMRMIPPLVIAALVLMLAWQGDYQTAIALVSGMWAGVQLPTTKVLTSVANVKP